MGATVGEGGKVENCCGVFAIDDGGKGADPIDGGGANPDGF